MGVYFEGSNTSIPDGNSITFLEQAYGNLKEQVYAQLMRRSHLADLYDMTFSYNPDGNNWTFNLENAIGAIQQEISQDNMAGKFTLREFTRTLKTLGFFDNETAADFYNSFKFMGEEYQFTMDTAMYEIKTGTQDYDTIIGTNADEAIFGKGGNDDFVFHRNLKLAA